MNSLPESVRAEARRLVESLASKGKLLTPEEAWLLSGETKDAQTLWSVAFQLAMRTETDAEDLNSWLESQFPQYAKSNHNHDGTSRGSQPFI